MTCIKMSKKWSATVLILSLFTIFEVCAQDLHYSQFYNSPQNLNPANTGNFRGDHRFIGSFRDQWRFVPVPWFTFSATYDAKNFSLLKGNRHFIGYGAYLNHDRQGDGVLNLSTVAAQGAYHYFLHPQHMVSGGLSVGISSRGFNSETLTWDSQWNGDNYDPSRPSGEIFDGFERINFLDMGMGLNYKYQRSERTNIDLGVGGIHLFMPEQKFDNRNTAKLPVRWSFSAIGNVKLISALDLQLHALYQSQGVYDETVFGGLGKIYISHKKGNETQLHLGLGYRTSGSLIPKIALQYNNYYASFSYDSDRTGFNNTLGILRGGPEFHFKYTIMNVPALRDFKVCPIY